jgi:type II secretory pathway pseudopilin PulG
MRSRPTSDDGFTLVELVMAIMVLFIALAASTQIVISMVTTTLSNRHIDMAMSVATQTMENAVAFDCGGQLVRPGWTGTAESGSPTPTEAFFSRLQDRCKVETNRDPLLSTAGACAPDTLPSGGVDAFTDGVFRRGYVPLINQNQVDLGSRRFVVNKKATSFGSATNSGSLVVCTTIRMSWKRVKAFGADTRVDDGSNDSLRLQRQVHVQWREPNQTRYRFRDLVQVSSLPPDSKVAVNRGRIAVEVGAGNAASLVLPTGQLLTLVADDDAGSGLANFPFLPDGTYQIRMPDLTVRTVNLPGPSGSRAQCVSSGVQADFVGSSCQL